MRASLWAVVAAAGLGSACSALFGVDDLTYGDPEGAGGSGGGASTSSGSGAGGTGGSTTSSGTGGQSSTSSGTGGTGGAGAGSSTGGGGGAPLEWTLVATLAIPGDCSDAILPFFTDDQQSYRLRVSGTLVINANNQQGDAEYWDFSALPGSAKDTTAGIDYGVAIDDPIVDGNKVPNWGPLSMIHTYEIELPGTGFPFVANLHDPDCTNNSGSLTLEVFALQ